MAKGGFKKTAGIILIILNLIIGIFYLTGCVVTYLDISSFPTGGFIGIAFPYLFLLLMGSFCLWLVIRPKLAVIPLLVLLCGWKQVGVLLAFNYKAGFNIKKTEDQIRVADWNIRSFNGLSDNKEIKKHAREDITAALLRLKPDIICLQEFNTSKSGVTESDNISLFAKKYPYYYFSKDYQGNSRAYHSGCIIFSKYPILDTGKIKFKPAESLIYIDALVGADTIRVYNTHLQSFKFKKEDYDDMDKIKEQDEEALAASRNLFQKMRMAFRQRGKQANLVAEELENSPYPSVICADFNDVPNSYTYFKIKNDWQDAFLQKGYGIGRSFITLGSTLRIDYILADNHFNIMQFDMVDEDLSDHILLVTDVQLKK